MAEAEKRRAPFVPAPQDLDEPPAIARGEPSHKVSCATRVQISKGGKRQRISNESK